MGDEPKQFKSVEMKNKIQAELLAVRELLGEAEFNHRRQEWLRTSDNPLAAMWREMGGPGLPPPAIKD
jgi:hypothetical protein